MSILLCQCQSHFQSQFFLAPHSQADLSTDCWLAKGWHRNRAGQSWPAQLSNMGSNYSDCTFSNKESTTKQETIHSNNMYRGICLLLASTKLLLKLLNPQNLLFNCEIQIKLQFPIFDNTSIIQLLKILIIYRDVLFFIPYHL